MSKNLSKNLAKNLLLFSSSRVGNTGYLEHALPLIEQFLVELHLATSAQNKQDNRPTTTKKYLFIPYAGISIGFERYEAMLKEAVKEIDIDITSLHHSTDKVQAIEQCDGIITGGGNTFALLNSLYELELIEAIRKAVENGTPYIGWSAGSNIAAPSIRTTNDMPIVEPRSFEALNLIPWQINPHYIDGNPPGHNGETRQQRIEEFLIVNPDKQVIGIPEGTALKLHTNHLKFIGEIDGYLFTGKSKVTFNKHTDLNHLLKYNETDA